MNTRFGIVGVRDAPRLRGALTGVAAGHGLVVAGAVVLGAVGLPALAAASDGLWFVVVLAAGAVVSLLVAGGFGMRAALDARVSITPAGADADQLARTLRAVGVPLSVAFIGAIWASMFSSAGPVPYVLAFVLVAVSLQLTLAHAATVYRCLSGPGYRTGGVEPTGDTRLLEPGVGGQVRRGQSGLVVLFVLLALLGSLVVLAGSALAPSDVGAGATAALLAAYAVSGALLIPLGCSSAILRRAISGDVVHLPGLHRAVRPVLWGVAAAALAVPVLAVALAVAVADPERPLLFVPLIVVLPGYLLGLQMLTLSRLYLGDIPARRRRGARR